MERRTSPRFPVQFTVDFSSQHTVGVGTVRDLSTEGCMAESNLIVHTGGSLALRLHLPDQEAPMEVTEAAVRWSQGQRVGLQFLRMGDDEQERLRRCVSTLETRPSRMERRGYPRFRVQFPISFSGDDLAGEGTVIDISKRGWKATVTRTLSVQQGTYLKLRLSLPDQAPPMDVDSAAVRWAKGREFGIEFLIMGSEEEERLRRFVSTLETGLSH
ncbi:PilZ domain-containing protein [Nitrospiraceae bacterium AH_259_D15_M11_P09]|nr:PilZ domain-containing protein [Nitrospiraceae bacterium AH_259_D15_M11_P09]